MKIKNLINLLVLTIILFISLAKTVESKDKAPKKDEKNITDDDLDDDDDYDPDDGDNENKKDNITSDMFENEQYEQKLHSICEKYNIKKDSKITKAQLKEVFIELFKEEQRKENPEYSNKKEDKYELYDTVLNEAFNRLTYDLDQEDITYDNLKNILSLDKTSKIMIDILSQMMPEFDDEL